MRIAGGRAMSGEIALRPYLPQDAPLLAEMFRSAIQELAADDYDAAQRDAWAAAADDVQSFGARLAAALTLVASRQGDVAGFASLKDASVIDMLYVSPAAAEEGVATTLLDALEKLAAARGAAAVTAEASDTAMPVFAARGYVPQQRNSVQRAGQWLANTTMKKSLGGDGTAAMGGRS